MTGIEAAVAAAAFVSAAASAVAAVQQGQAAEDAAEAQADQLEREGKIAQQSARVEETLQRARTRRLIARQRAVTAAQGTTAEGSPLAIIAETAGEAELDALAIRFSGDLASVRRRSEAAASRAEGRAARTAGFIRGGARLLSGASELGPLVSG